MPSLSRGHLLFIFGRSTELSNSLNRAPFYTFIRLLVSWNLVVAFHRATGWLLFLPNNFGVSGFIWIEALRLGICRNEGDINAAIVSEPARSGITRSLFRRLVWISILQVANRGFVQRFLLAIRIRIDLLACDSLRNQELLNPLHPQLR